MSGFSEEDVRKIMEMEGCDDEVARDALEEVGGNIKAAQFLVKDFKNMDIRSATERLKLRAAGEPVEVWAKIPLDKRSEIPSRPAEPIKQRKEKEKDLEMIGIQNALNMSADRSSVVQPGFNMGLRSNTRTDKNKNKNRRSSRRGPSRQPRAAGGDMSVAVRPVPSWSSGQEHSPPRAAGGDRPAPLPWTSSNPSMVREPSAQPVSTQSYLLPPPPITHQNLDMTRATPSLEYLRSLGPSHPGHLGYISPGEQARIRQQDIDSATTLEDLENIAGYHTPESQQLRRVTSAEVAALGHFDPVLGEFVGTPAFYTGPQQMTSIYTPPSASTQNPGGLGGGGSRTKRKKRKLKKKSKRESKRKSK